MKKLLLAMLLSTLGCSLANAANTLQNPGFETPNFEPNGFAYIGCAGCLANDPMYGWTFTGSNGGIGANGSAIGVTGATDNQAGFLQVGGSSISQSFDFDGTQFSLSFLAEYRNYQGNGPNPLTVFVDGTQLTFNGGIDSSLSPASSSMFNSYTTDSIQLAAGTHLLKFSGVGVGAQDVTSFIDEVAINASSPGTTAAVPEPASIALLSLGLLGFAASRRKSSNKNA
jgi:hypothetical protein